MAQQRTRQERSGAGPSRRAEILRVAAELFAEKGFDATTIQDIADRVGMLKGSLYYHIKSKEELLFEVVDEAHRIFSGNLDAVRELEGGALEKIWAFVYRNVLANATYLVPSAVFFNEFRSIRESEREQIVAMRDAHDAMLRDLIEEGQRAEKICPDLDVKLAAIGILTMCNALYRWYRPGGTWSADDVARGYAGMAVAGLACDPELHEHHRSLVDAEQVIGMLGPFTPPDEEPGREAPAPS